MNLNNAKVPKVPAGAATLIKAGVLGVAGLYIAANAFYNVEGGHRAIVFNRLHGIKDKVLLLGCGMVFPECCHCVITWPLLGQLLSVRSHHLFLVIFLICILISNSDFFFISSMLVQDT